MSNTHTAPFRPVRVVSGYGGPVAPDPGVAQPGRAEVERRMAGRPPAKRADRSERASVREELARIDTSGDFDAPAYRASCFGSSSRRRWPAGERASRRP
jgi:hypothetical protein